ncbi:MAG: ferritin family protein [Planctomycetota bacterium]|jgi:rubrerythrin
MVGKPEGDPEGAVAAAIKLEEDGRRFYLESAAKTANELVKRMFESLAADETNHIDWIHAKNPEVESSLDANRALYAKLKGIFADAPAAGGAESDSAAIDVAIGMEEKSAAAYAEWAAEGATDEIRKLGAVLVGQEKFHRQLLENTKEYLDSPGDWFLSEERWNFEGG